MTVRVEDRTGQISDKDKESLTDFIVNHLLSSPEEIVVLSKIIISDAGNNGEYGYWQGEIIIAPDNTISFSALIQLNAYYLTRLEELKETLAHEYGHHWTLYYYTMHRKGEIYTGHLPDEYYTLRSLDKSKHCFDYSRGWLNCDREIIAEDYRVLFAPYPYNQDHKMENLTPPCEQTKYWIRNLKRNSL